MNTTKEIARHIREIHFGNNWTDSCMKDVLADVTFREAIARPMEANTIAMLVFHMNFYLKVVHDRLKNMNIVFNQEDTFAVPSIHSEDEWLQLVDKTFEDAEAFAKTVEQLTDADLGRSISKQHGSVYKNLHGVVEHNHYHLGQIVLLKKMIRQ